MEYKKAYIFGAQSRGKTLEGYLKFLYPEVEILSFLVDDRKENDECIDGIPVYTLTDMKEWDKSAAVYIATKGIYHAEIQKRLEGLGIQNVIPVTVELDNFFRNEYVRKYMERQKREFVKIENLRVSGKSKPQLSARIYMAKSIYDKPLKTAISLPEYVTPIQVGASLTEERLAPDILTDCTGDNISDRNRQYCELTAVYWMWKQAQEDIVGLCHYRRHFVLPAEWQEMMGEQKIDVILPVPTFVSPSIAANYMERHDAAVWKSLMEYLKENCPKDYEAAEKVFWESLYSPCNMFIMKREIMQNLCAWMFPILFAVEEHCGEKEDGYQNRYPGFLSERLITLFFYIMRDKYKIIYADKIFLN